MEVWQFAILVAGGNWLTICGSKENMKGASDAVEEAVTQGLRMVTLYGEAGDAAMSTRCETVVVEHILAWQLTYAATRSAPRAKTPETTERNQP